MIRFYGVILDPPPKTDIIYEDPQDKKTWQSALVQQQIKIALMF